MNFIKLNSFLTHDIFQRYFLALDLEKVSKVDLFNATWNDMGLSGHQEISENCDFSIFSPKNQPTLNDFKQKLASAEESLKKGIFSRTKTERIRSLHFGLLTVSV